MIRSSLRLFGILAALVVVGGGAASLFLWQGAGGSGPGDRSTLQPSPPMPAGGDADIARRRAEEEARRGAQQAERNLAEAQARERTATLEREAAADAARRAEEMRRMEGEAAARRRAEEEARLGAQSAMIPRPVAPPAPPPAPPPVSPPAADALPDFPWPPPRPSSRQEIDRQMIAPAGHAMTLRGVADRLEAALRRAQYEYSFYGIPGGGFALVARLERIEADGAASAGDRRFLPPDAREPFDLGRYLSALFFAPAGYYRMIAFVVTDRPFTVDEAPLDAARARRLPGGGASALPAPLAARPFGPDDRVFALIYEFRKDTVSGDAAALVPGRLPALTHLARSGLQPALETGPAGRDR